MTCAEFNETLKNEDFYNEIHSEMHWDDSYSSDKVWESFTAEAKNRNITLTDTEEWDYDTEFYKNYQLDSDKGLS